jgi:hypothetical protein
VQADLLFTESHMDLPGAPDIVKQLDAYLDAKGVRHLFVELGEMLLQRTPANPVRRPPSPTPTYPMLSMSSY